MPASAPSRVLAGPGVCLGGGGGLPEQEEGGLDPLADDRGEGQDRESPQAALGQGAVDPGVQFALDVRRRAAHPEQHPGDHAGGEHHGAPLEVLLGG